MTSVDARLEGGPLVSFTLKVRPYEDVAVGRTHSGSLQWTTRTASYWELASSAGERCTIASASDDVDAIDPQGMAVVRTRPVGAQECLDVCDLLPATTSPLLAPGRWVGRRTY